MRIKNLKYVVGGIAIFTLVSFPKLVSDHYEAKLESLMNNANTESEQPKMTIETLPDIEIEVEDSTNEQLISDELALKMVEVQPEQVDLEEIERNQLALQIAEELDERIFQYDSSTHTISISGYHISKDQLTDDFYENLNLLLSYSCDYKLKLSDLGNEIDFSRLNLENIRELSLNDCSDKFDYDFFSHQSYNNLTFFNIPYKNAIQVTENTTTSETSIGYSNDSFHDRLQYVKFLVENDICIDSFYQLGGYNDIDSDMYSLLSQLNARCVSSYEWDTKDVSSKMDMDFNLNDKIEYFNIQFAGQTELGNINVLSNNNNLNVEFFNILLTENTCFSIPDHTRVYLSGEYSDIHAFDDFSKVSYLSYHDDILNGNVFWNNDTSFDEAISAIEKMHDDSYTN